MNIKEVMRTEVEERRKAGARLPLQMFGGLLVIAVAFIALLYFFAPGGKSNGLMPAPVLGIVVSPDMTVVGVEPNSIAEESGLKAGDKLDKVDGQTVKSLDDTRNKMLDDLYNQKEITLGVIRNNQPLDLKLKPGSSSSKSGSPGPTATPVPNGYAYF
jgi:membrane-associated protease RseP (regulator of RpoE activity)